MPDIPIDTLGPTETLRYVGEDPGDEFARAGAALGDVNGDGMQDFAISAGGAGPSGRGEVYVIYGDPDGLDQTDGAFNVGDLDGAAGFVVRGAGVGDGVSRVAAAGDVNGDGVDDFIVASTVVDIDGVRNPGAAYVVYGADAGFPALLDLSDIDGVNGYRLTGDGLGDFAFGRVVGAGDVNGDGYADILVSNGTKADFGYDGRVVGVLVYGGPDAAPASRILTDLTSAEASLILTAEGLGREDFAAAGDINGDGFADLFFGGNYSSDNDRTDDASGADVGFIVYGDANGLGAALDLSDPALGADVMTRIDGAVGLTNFGRYAAAGDINADGLDDLAMGGAYYVSGNGTEADVFVVFGVEGGLGDRIDLDDLNGANGFHITDVIRPVDANETPKLSIGGDFNADGFNDVLIGSEYRNLPSDLGGFIETKGEAHLFPGGDSFEAEERLSDVTAYQGANRYDHLGSVVDFLGDVNGDGAEDILIGVRGEDPTGAAYVIFGEAEARPATAEDDLFDRSAVLSDHGAWSRLAGGDTVVVANDSSPNGGVAPVSLGDAGLGVPVVGTNGGEGRLFANGAFDFREDRVAVTGADTSFTYAIRDDAGQTAEATITVSVDVGAGSLIAEDDTYAVAIGDLSDGRVRLGAIRDHTHALANDAGPEGEAFQIVALDGGAAPGADWIAGANGGEFRVFASGVVDFRDLDGDLSAGDATSIGYVIETGDGDAATAEIILTVDDLI